MVRILIGAAAAAAGYYARRRGVRVLLPWGDGIGTLGFHFPRMYFDFYKPARGVGLFWCRRDASGNIVEKGRLNLCSGDWTIESVNGEARGKWSYLRRCRRNEVAA